MLSLKGLETDNVTLHGKACSKALQWGPTTVKTRPLHSLTSQGIWLCLVEEEGETPGLLERVLPYIRHPRRGHLLNLSELVITGVCP